MDSAQKEGCFHDTELNTAAASCCDGQSSPVLEVEMWPFAAGEVVPSPLPVHQLPTRPATGEDWAAQDPHAGKGEARRTAAAPGSEEGPWVGTESLAATRGPGVDSCVLAGPRPCPLGGSASVVVLCGHSWSGR